MSSGNLIQHNYLKEAVFGVLNPVGTFQNIAKTSANFSGTPDTTQSNTVRDDRLPSGNIIAGLTVEGAASMELSRTKIHDDFIEATMMSQWSALAAPVTQAIAYDAAAGEISGAGDFTISFIVGDVFTINGLVAPADGYNATTIFVVTAVAATILTVTTGESVESFDSTAGAGASMQKGQSITIGKDIASFTFEKQYLDLTARAIDYLGEVFNSFNTNFAYGSAVTQDYALMGSSKVVKTLDPTTAPAGSRDAFKAPTEKFFNATTGMPWISVDGEIATYCIESIAFGLANGLAARNCVGKLEKTAFDLGEAAITLDVNMHFGDANWHFLDKIMAQSVVNFEWPIVDEDGLGYHYQVSAQLTGPDPDTTGKDAQAMLALSGTGAIGDKGGVLNIWKIGGDLPAGDLIDNNPVAVSAVVEDAADTDIVITFSEDVLVADISGFTVNGSVGATAVSTVSASGTAVTLVMNGSVIDTETITVDYDSAQTSNLRNASDESLKVATFSGFAVTNNVAP